MWSFTFESDIPRCVHRQILISAPMKHDRVADQNGRANGKVSFRPRRDGSFYHMHAPKLPFKMGGMYNDGVERHQLLRGHMSMMHSDDHFVIAVKNHDDLHHLSPLGCGPRRF
jgi:hypothetical protein